MKIVDTDNFGGDYPNEKVFIDGIPTKELAEKIASAINGRFVGTYSSRYYKVVEDDYELQPGFEP